MQTTRSFVGAPFLCTIGVLCVAGAGCTKEVGGNAAIQAVVDATAKKDPDILRLTVHCAAADRKSTVVLASTLPAKIGKSSDKEDLDALATGKTIVLEEPNARDFSVPVLPQNGEPTHVIGVTLKAPPDANKEALQAKAAEIANSLAAAI